MSYILDALKRAEQQRGGATHAALRAPRSIPLDTASRGPWPWIAAGGVGLGVVVAAVALWPITTPPPPVTSAPDDVATSAPPGTVAPHSTPATRPAPPVVSKPTAPSAPAPSDRRVGGRTASPPAIDRSVVSRAPVPSAVDRDARGTPNTPPVARSAPPAAPPPVAHSAPRPVDAPPLARSMPRPDVSRPAPPRASAPGTAPSTGAGGGEAKALAAKISLQVVGWAPEPKDRFVFLNGRRYGEGQLVDDKLLVERITEDGVVLSYQGDRVTLKGR